MNLLQMELLDCSPLFLLFLVGIISQLSKSCIEWSVQSNYCHLTPPPLPQALWLYFSPSLLLITNTLLICCLLVLCSILPTAAKAWFVLRAFSLALAIFPSKRIKYLQLRLQWCFAVQNRVCSVVDQ